MNKYNLNIDEEIAILEKYQLTPNELFVVRLILVTKEGYPENYLFKFLQINDCKKGFRPTLVSLQNKGVILKSYKIPDKGQSFDPAAIPFSKNFETALYRSAFDMGQELYEAYPMFAEIQGATVSIRGVSKKFNTLEDAFRYYGKQIRWNQETHKHILELLDWAQNNTSFINFSLATFLVDRKWEEIEALKNGDITNVNYNSMRSI